MPQQFGSKIVAATGQCAGDTGLGSATLREFPARVSVGPPGTSCADFPIAPSFILTLQSA